MTARLKSMLEVKAVENSIFQSNTYIVRANNPSECILIDCGDVSRVMDLLHEGCKIPAVFITHAHFDHIYGLNELIGLFPECKVYASAYALDGLRDTKMNYSRYHDTEFVFDGDAVEAIEDGYLVSPIEDLTIRCIHTPGHDAGCMTYIIDGYIFTGDSYIPGVKTVTNLRGNKAQAAESEETIKGLASKFSLTICPGHGETLMLDN